MVTMGKWCLFNSIQFIIMINSYNFICCQFAWEFFVRLHCEGIELINCGEIIDMWLVNWGKLGCVVNWIGILNMFLLKLNLGDCSKYVITMLNFLLIMIKIQNSYLIISQFDRYLWHLRDHRHPLTMMLTGSCQQQHLTATSNPY